ncbi:Na+/melibiose symporter [Roseibium suaedae]|uniref:Na+/melibiose symporter n=2 Tax=Roseibium suaedae TaxID=735517 RepID=A0A1M7HJC9_9HYPH|nr:Na+/melibiose symporter [Roseibium suaedae]
MAHGMMAFPLAFAGLPIYLHAPDFYARTLGQPLSLLGLVLLALRVIDAIQDPLIGSLSDRWNRHRTLILSLGTTALAAGFWMIFHPIPDAPLVSLALSVFICTTGYSVVAINLQALGGTWRVPEASRTKVTTWREGFGLAGLLAASIAPTLLNAEAAPQAAFNLLSLSVVPFSTAALIVLTRWMRRSHFQLAAKSSAGFGWKLLLRHPWRRHFFGLYALNTCASAIPAVLVLFFIRDRLEAGHLTGSFLLLYFLSGVGAMPLWETLAKRKGKVIAWATSMALATATFFWAVFLGPGDVIMYAAVCALSGLALGADLALPPALLADHIDRTSGAGEASRLFALMALISKGALAVATGIALPLLGLAGYQPGMEMTSGTGLWLSLAYAAIPCVLKALTLIWLIGQRQAIAP